MKEIVAWIIRIIHIFIVNFIVFSPIFGGEYLLSIHLLVVPFIMLHWLTNQTVCALTVMEKMLRGKDLDEETFFGQVVSPIYKGSGFFADMIRPLYDIQDEETERRVVWTGLILLWIITFARLWPTGFAHLRADFAALRALFRV
jgi:hypothetical protein